MKISLNWLREYIDFSGDEQSNQIASPEELADQLMMLGIEVDEIESMDVDEFFWSRRQWSCYGSNVTVS